MGPWGEHTRARVGLAAVALGAGTLGLVSVGFPPDLTPALERAGPILALSRVEPAGAVPVGLRHGGVWWVLLGLVAAAAVCLPWVDRRRAAWLTSSAVVIGAVALGADASTRRAGWLAVDAGSTASIATSGSFSWDVGAEVWHPSTDRPVSDVVLVEMHPSLVPEPTVECLALAPGEGVELWPGPGSTGIRVRDVGKDGVRVVVVAAEASREHWLQAGGGPLYTDGARVRLANVATPCGAGASASVVVRSPTTELARRWMTPGDVVHWGARSLQLTRVHQDGSITAIVRRRHPGLIAVGLAGLGLGLFTASWRLVAWRAR